MKNLFEASCAEEFWLKIKNKFSSLSQKALDKLLQFATTYLSEAAFSQMTAIKTKQRNRLDAHDAMVLAIISIEPRIEMLSKRVLMETHTFR